MGYRVELTRRAQRQLAALDKKTLLLIAAFIDKLDGSENPRALPQAKQLKGVANGWRWRVGSYRILGTIDDDRIVIELFRIGHQRDVYRRL